MTDILTSSGAKRMLGYLPEYYENSRIMKTILAAQGSEIDRLAGAVDEILDQFFVRTATWALESWEKELGLDAALDQTENERRDRIISRLRGTGTATINVVKNVAESYDKGAIEVIQDHTLYHTIIKFVDTKGVPPNLDDLKRALRAVVPAHLGIEFKLNYLIWDEIDSLNMTWDAWDALNLTWDELEVYI
ncbi:MAG: putative phage tail protein [Peptococcaceae bacterium]